MLAILADAGERAQKALVKVNRIDALLAEQGLSAGDVLDPAQLRTDVEAAIADIERIESELTPLVAGIRGDVKGQP